MRSALDDLRRANPVAEETASELVRGTAPDFLASVRAPVHGSPAEAGTGRASSMAPHAGATDLWRYRLVGMAAAVLALIAIPVVLLTLGTRGGEAPADMPDGELPAPDSVPAPDGITGPDDVSEPGDDGDMFEPRPDDDTARPPDDRALSSSSTTTTVPGSTTTLPESTTTSVESTPLIASNATTTVAPTTAAAPTTVAPTAAAPTAAAPPTDASTITTTTIAPVVTPLGDVANPFDPSLDLLMFTLDFSNRDDGHASVASREVAASVGFTPLVVAGTPSGGSAVFMQPYAEMMNAAWGTAWTDAAANRITAIDAVADRWIETIDAGGTIRVAEGGVSDFTADVLRDVQSRRADLDTTHLVQVVHHIANNQEQTRADDIAFLMASTNYVQIDDGNNSNDTADLFRPSPALEAAASTSVFADAWVTAFDYRPAAELDFSDVVTVLHIVGVGLDEVADPDDFAARFM